MIGAQAVISAGTPNSSFHRGVFRALTARPIGQVARPFRAGGKHQILRRQPAIGDDERSQRLSSIDATEPSRLQNTASLRAHHSFDHSAAQLLRGLFHGVQAGAVLFFSLLHGKNAATEVGDLGQFWPHFSKSFMPLAVSHFS